MSSEPPAPAAVESTSNREPSYSKQSTPASRAGEERDNDELDPSDDDLPDFVTRVIIKKEKALSPVVPLTPKPTLDNRGARNDSPINLISSSEDEESPSEDPEASEEERGSDMDDLYADPAADTTNDEDTQMVDEALTAGVAEESSQEELLAPVRPVVSVTARAPPKSQSPEKRRRHTDVFPFVSQPSPSKSASPVKFKKPTSKSRASLATTQAFAESIIRPTKNAAQAPPSVPASAPSPAKSTPQPQPRKRRPAREEAEEEEEEPPVAKRSRTSTTAVSTPPPVRPSPAIGPKETRHHEYWLLDGSVVVCVQKTCFKLHRSTLINKSKYFKSIISDPPLGTDGLRCDIDDVSVLDFERLLKAIDAGVAYVFEPPPFHVLASILRAASTLEFTQELEFASRSIRAMWPCELAGLTKDGIPNAAATINLAKDCDMPEVLKRAYYELLRSDALGQDPENFDFERQEDHDNSTIPRDDLISLIKTREQLWGQWYSLADRPPNKNGFYCPLQLAPNPEGDQPAPTPEQLKCASAHEKSFEHWDTQVKTSGIFQEFMYDPLCGLERLSKIEWEKLGYCDGCVKSWRRQWGIDRAKLWGNLDVWLRLAEQTS